MSIDAAQVQQAYTVPLNFGAQVNNFLQEEYQRKQRQEELDLKRDMQQAQLMSESMEPFRKGTGTPYDNYKDKRLQDIIRDYGVFMKQNPRAKYSDQVMFFQNQLGDLSSQMDNARLLQKQIEAIGEKVDKEYPLAVDRVAFLNELNKYGFYDGDNVRERINPSDVLSYANSILQDDNRLSKFINEAGINEGLAKKLGTLYPAQRRTIEGKAYDFDVDLRDFQQFNPKTEDVEILSEQFPVEWEEFGIKDFKPTKEVKKAAFSALPREVYQSLSGNRDFRLATLNRLAKMEEAKPQMFKNLNQQDKERLVAYSILNEVGNLKGQVKRNYERQRFERQSQQMDEYNRIRRDHLTIAQNRDKRLSGMVQAEQNIQKMFDAFSGNANALKGLPSENGWYEISAISMDHALDHPAKGKVKLYTDGKGNYMAEDLKYNQAKKVWLPKKGGKYAVPKEDGEALLYYNQTQERAKSAKYSYTEPPMDGEIDYTPSAPINTNNEDALKALQEIQKQLQTSSKFK